VRAKALLDETVVQVIDGMQGCYGTSFIQLVHVVSSGRVMAESKVEDAVRM